MTSPHLIIERPRFRVIFRLSFFSGRFDSSTLSSTCSMWRNISLRAFDRSCFSIAAMILRCVTMDHAYAIRLQRFLTASAQHFRPPRHEFLQRLVPRGAANGQMQLGVRLHTGLAATYRLGLLGNNSFQLRNVTACSPARRLKRRYAVRSTYAFRTRPRELFFHRSAAARAARSRSTGRSATKLPVPVRATMSPWVSNARSASRTEVRLTLKVSANSRSDGVVTGPEPAILDELMDLVEDILVYLGFLDSPKHHWVQLSAGQTSFYLKIINKEVFSLLKSSGLNFDIAGEIIAEKSGLGGPLRAQKKG